MELKACPFCKRSARIEPSPNDNGRFIVRCSSCPCALVVDFGDKEQAALAWNYRKRGGWKYEE